MVSSHLRVAHPAILFSKMAVNHREGGGIRPHRKDEGTMARVVLGMTMSLDGFINDRNGGVGALYPDLEALRNAAPMRESIQRTGGPDLRPHA